MPDEPAHRYNAKLANEIERKWQDRWDEQQTFYSPNPKGSLAEPNHELAARDPLYVLDMFPYPSGAGLHVGHPLGYIATDIYSRFMRMSGRNVLHAMGYDAFGLPAEQYAVQKGEHPRKTTEENIATMRRQLRALGLGHDPRRGISTIDVSYYRWTQWVFLQIYNSWYDTDAQKARPISDLIEEFESGKRHTIDGRAWSRLSDEERAEAVDSFRLAYIAEAAVNWCPGLGTVLANEEVTIDGRSDRGNFPVYKRPLKQWMLRITSYADRLLNDLDLLDWSESIKLMQRNWIGRSTGADVDFEVVGHDNVVIRVYTTRPDTLFGATYMVLAPEHPLVEEIVPTHWPGENKGLSRSEFTPWPITGESTEVPMIWKGQWGTKVTPPEAVAEYRRFAAAETDIERQAEDREKTGVFTGAFALNPVTGEQIPIFIADYVLMGYGTGAIMAVPAHDERDFAFAQAFGLEIRKVVEPTSVWLDEHNVAADTDAKDWPEAFSGDGYAVASENESLSLDGLRMDEAKRAIIAWLEHEGYGKTQVNYKLRDWLFSRQRYWGEPFPIVYDEEGRAHAVPESMLPVELPEMTDVEPKTSDDPDALPEPPLARAQHWVEVELDLGDGPKKYRRETNTMPQWAGSCWYYLRYLDPENDGQLADPEIERYWMQGTAGDAATGGVDLYVGGVEHAVLHLLYARFWHKVLYDLGYVSTPEPFQRLFNQGYILAPAFQDQRGIYVEAAEVEERNDKFYFHDEEVQREYGKMGKSLKNVVTPDDIYEEFGADTLRLYEMFMGPLDASRPWNTSDIIGVHRFLQRFWRNLIDETTGSPRITEDRADEETRRVLHRTIDVIMRDMSGLSFNTAIARLFELNNYITQKYAKDPVPREVAEPFVLMLAPLAPHTAEEVWERLGHEKTLTYETFPKADSSLLVQKTVNIPVQVNGKVRATISVASDASESDYETAARQDEKVATYLKGKDVKKVVVVPGRMISFVV